MARIRAPEFPQDFVWLNSLPLSLKALRGRLVLLDFWTYGCINCLHILPDLKALEQKYASQLTVIGVHSAKFDHEQDLQGVQQAIARHSITHPVLIDQQFRIWQDYTVRAYPTLILIDPQGYIVATVSGEGHRSQLEGWIDQLIAAQEDHSEWTLVNNPVIIQPLATPLAFPGKVLAAQDRLFIADSGHHRVVVTGRSHSLSGERVHDLQQVIGTGTAGLQDGTFEEAQFCNPQGMAWDERRSHLYITDTDNHVIRRVNFKTQTVETIAGTGQQNRSLSPQQGSALTTALNSPWDLVKIDQNLFIAMAGNHQIWRLNLTTQQIQTFAGTGAEGCYDAIAPEAAFAQPSGIATDGQRLFVADSEGSSIRAVNLNPPFEVTTVCGSGDLYGFGDRDGKATAARLQHCMGVAYDPNRLLWIADTYNHKIKRLDLTIQNCQTFYGSEELAEACDRPSLDEPAGVSLWEQTLYIADTNHHRICWVDLGIGEMAIVIIPGLCSLDVCLPH
ncbi:MAG: redoxin domain-containing protein [Oculatellaceae cyanobacterium Prado106]|nr:redoxin domain-containing protein [Oculatellaceae cyanobacterium Prado106]